MIAALEPRDATAPPSTTCESAERASSLRRDASSRASGSVDAGRGPRSDGAERRPRAMSVAADKPSSAESSACQLAATLARKNVALQGDTLVLACGLCERVKEGVGRNLDGAHAAQRRVPAKQRVARAGGSQSALGVGQHAIESAPRNAHAEKLSGNVFQLMRLVENHRVVVRQARALGADRAAPNLRKKGDG